MTPTPKELAEKFLEARSKATQGEWTLGHNTTPCGIESSIDRGDWVVSPCDDYRKPLKQDAEFITLSANHITSVCNRLLELEKLTAKQAKQLEQRVKLLEQANKMLHRGRDEQAASIVEYRAKLTAAEAKIKAQEVEIKLHEAKMMAATSFIRTRILCRCQTTLKDVKDKYPTLVCEKCQMLNHLTKTESEKERE